ncbi:MAG TPA: APC family permease [Rhizomicrobium sp.]|nr:APC family permease [Rhizomicrobium sp.]
MTDATVAAPEKLKFWDAAFYTLAVGTGIRWIAVAAAVGPSSLPMWGLAFVTFFIPLSVATLELTARFDDEGGIYSWARGTLGPLAGFTCGWFYWTNLLPYFAGILYFLSGLILAAFGGDPKDTLLYMSISFGLTLLVTAMQIAGLKYGKWVPNIGMASGWLVLGVIVLVAIVIGGRGQSATNFLHSSYLPVFNFDTAILWGTIVFAFCGVEGVAFLRNEIEGGMRTVARVLLIAGISSVCIYVLGTMAFLVILPSSELSRLGGFADALRAGLSHVGTSGLAPFVILLFALSMLGGFAANFLMGTRLLFTAGIDSYLPPSFARRHPKTGAPVYAILMQSGLTLAMVVLSQAGSSVAGAYDFMVAMGVLTIVIPYVFMFIGHLKIQNWPALPGAWAPPGGKRTSIVLGWVGLISTLVAIVCTLIPNSSEPHPFTAFVKIVLAALAMLVVGIALYWLADRRRRAALLLAQPAE